MNIDTHYKCIHDCSQYIYCIETKSMCQYESDSVYIEVKLNPKATVIMYIAVC